MTKTTLDQLNANAPKGVKYSTDPLPNKEAIIHFKGKTLLTSQSYLDVKAYEHALAFTVAKMADEDLLKMTRDAIQSAMENGTDFRDFKKNLLPYLSSQGWANFSTDRKTLNRRLRTIYHTNMHSSYSAGQWQRIQQTKEFLPYLQYMPSLSVKKRDNHKAYYGLVRPVDDDIWQSIFPPNGFGCFLGDVQIQGDLQSAMVKWYEGVAIELTTQSGRSLAVTANHPILTARGWVRADSLTTSDNVLCYGLPIDAVNADGLSGQVHYNQTVPTAKNLFKAFFDQTFAFTGTTAFKFNSDVANGEIHIDVINDGLVCHIWADVLQGVKQVKLIRGDDGRFVAIGKSNSSSCFATVISDFIGSQNTSDIATTAIKTLCQSTLAYFGCGVQMNDFSFQFVITRTTDRPSLSTLPFNTTSRLFDVLPTSHTGTTHISQDDTILTQLASNAFTTDFGLFGYLVDTHSSLVFTDPIINIQQFSFSGHCYDFQSSESIVSANGIIAHNCKCWVKQLTKRQAEKIGISDPVDLEMETVENPRTGEKMTTPKGVHFSFAHNHDRLTALLKLAEDKHGTEFSEKVKEQLVQKFPEVVSKIPEIKVATINSNKTDDLNPSELIRKWVKDDDTIKKWLDLYERSYKRQLNLTEDEFIALRYYTANGYQAINRYLNGIGTTKDEMKAIFERIKPFLNDVIYKLPIDKKHKKLYRWLYLPDEVLEKYQTGEIVEFNAFTSTTHDKDKKVDLTGNSNVKFIITHKTGRWVEEMSQHKSEKEVLLPTNTRHKVRNRRSIKATKEHPAHILIELEEIT